MLVNLVNILELLLLLIHTDVWGPSHTVSLKGHRWFVSFIDDFSRTTWLYITKEKREEFSIFQNFHDMVRTQFGAIMKILRFDNGGEYIDSRLGGYFSSHEILHQTSCTDTPQQNGVTKRKNRHLLDIARYLLF